jgi:hypothetical protein
MTASNLTAREHAVLVLARLSRFTSRCLVLSVALVCYGSVPSTPQVQTETESQLQEEAASSAANHADLRTKLRGSAHRRAGAAVLASAELMSCRRIAAAATSEHLGPQLSLGLAVPLRC